MPSVPANGWYAPTSTNVWVSWNTSTSSATTCSISTWDAWNATGSATATAGTWVAWNTGYSATGVVVARAALPAETPEQAQARMQRAAAWREESIRIEGERAKARERAETLLRESLSPKQLEELAANNHFHLDVIAASGERRTYRIKRGRSRNVQQVAQGTGQATRNIAGVTEAASETGAAATQVLNSARELARNAETLRAEMGAFLGAMRAA